VAQPLVQRQAAGEVTMSLTMVAEAAAGRVNPQSNISLDRSDGLRRSSYGLL